MLFKATLGGQQRSQESLENEIDSDLNARFTLHACAGVTRRGSQKGMQLAVAR
jgi:hypothetical protein